MPDEPITTSGPAYVPPEVVDYLGSEEAVNANLEIMKKYELKDQDMEYIFELLWDVIEKRRAPKAIPVELGTRFKRWDEKKINSLSLDLLGKKLLPLSNMISGVEEEIKEIGGKPEDYPHKKVVPKAVTVSELTQNAIHDLNIRLPDKFLKSRLENVLNSKIKGVRDDFETKNRMIRGEKIGGLDIAPSQADEIIQYVDSALKTVKIIDEKPAAPRPAVPKEEGAEEHEHEVPLAFSKKETGTTEAYTVRPEDIDEIEVEEANVIPAPVLNEYNRIEKDIVKESGLSFENPDMQKNFENIVRARVRDVRDKLETKNMLTRGPADGGIGLSPQKADELIALVDNKLIPLRQKLAGMEAEERESAIAKQKRNQELSEEKERSELDERFAKLTGRTPAALPREEKKVETTIPLKEEIIKPKHKAVPLAAPLSVSGTAISPPSSAPVKTPPPSAPPRIPAQKPSTPPAPELAPPPPAASVPASRPRTAPAEKPAVPALSAPPKPKVRLSGPATAAPEAAARRKVEEIKAPKKLFGPIEELREMKLEDFRRLSKDPKERAIKIKDKVDLLEEESFDKKMKGVAAWQESPINGLYLNLIQEAFQTGKNIQTIISAREAAGRPTLSWEEFQSILDLNQKLKIS